MFITEDGRNRVPLAVAFEHLGATLIQMAPVSSRGGGPVRGADRMAAIS